MQSFLAVRKNPIQCFSDVEVMEQSAQYPERWLVHDLVDQQHFIIFLPNFMVVVPESVRAKSLFIDKGMSDTNMLDLRHPGMGTPQGDSDPVLDNKPVVHDCRDIGNNMKSEIFRGNPVKIGGILEECPCLLH